MRYLSYLYLFEYGALETPSDLDYFLKIRAMNCCSCNCQAVEAMVISASNGIVVGGLASSRLAVATVVSGGLVSGDDVCGGRGC